MDYILDYFNDLSNTNNGEKNYVFSSLHNIQLQDPLSKLINWLNTERGAGIKIKSEEDILIEDFLYKNKSNIIQLNLDDKKNIPKEKNIVIYCSIGYRSEKIGEKLLRLGYKNVYNLYGSIFEWANEKYPLVGSNGKTTDRVHGYNKSWSKWVTNEEIKTVW